jgi:hypothetical protein
LRVVSALYFQLAILRVKEEACAPGAQEQDGHEEFLSIGGYLCNDSQYYASYHPIQLKHCVDAFGLYYNAVHIALHDSATMINKHDNEQTDETITNSLKWQERSV